MLKKLDRNESPETTANLMKRISIGWLYCADGSINLTPCVDGNMFPHIVNITYKEFELVRGSKEKMIVLAAERLGL